MMIIEFLKYEVEKYQSRQHRLSVADNQSSLYYVGKRFVSEITNHTKIIILLKMEHH